MTKTEQPIVSNIVMILDESGSMSSVTNDIIVSVNDFIKYQKECSPNTTFTFVKFSTTHQTLFSKPLKEVEYLTSKDYVPTGSTALYDAIGDTIEQFKNKEKLIMVVVTDGQENASCKHKREDVFKTITACQTEKKWNFIYLSCDIDTFAQGNGIGCSNGVGSAYNAVLGGQQNNIAVGQSALGSMLAGQLNYAIGGYCSTGRVDQNAAESMLNATKKTLGVAVGNNQTSLNNMNGYGSRRH